MIKIIFTTVFLLLQVLVFAQSVGVDNGLKSSFENLYDLREMNDYNIGLNSKIKGTVFLFEDWNNKSVVYSIFNTYQLDKLNYNMLNDNFSVELSKDSLYILSKEKIDSVSIDSRTFVKRKLDNKVSFYEKIVQTKSIVLLKKYDVSQKEGSFNPLDGKTSPSVLYKEETYYIDNNGLTKIKPSKKTILPYFKDKANEVNKFLKENKISFKKDSDLKELFKFYNSLK
jgi:hypothetical protein